MLTIIHLLFDLLLYLGVGRYYQLTILDLALLLSVSLIDLDHLWSKPVYLRGRNSFKTHFLHKHWKWMLLMAFVFVLNRYTLFLGVGILSHFLLDHLDAARDGRRSPA